MKINNVLKWILKNPDIIDLNIRIVVTILRISRIKIIVEQKCIAVAGDYFEGEYIKILRFTESISILLITVVYLSELVKKNLTSVRKDVN